MGRPRRLIAEPKVIRFLVQTNRHLDPALVAWTVELLSPKARKELRKARQREAKIDREWWIRERNRVISR